MQPRIAGSSLHVNDMWPRVLGKWRMEMQCSKLNLKKTDVAQMQADGAMGFVLDR